MNFKKTIVLALTGVMMTSSIVTLAQLNETKGTNENEIEIISVKPQDSHDDLHHVLVVNDKGLNPQDHKVYYKGDTLMIPLRVVADSLGYKVQWDAETRVVELVKESHSVVVVPGKDHYCFGEMAPTKLGTSAEITDSKTYVPLNFLTDILKVKVYMDETGGVNIKSQNQTEKVTLLEMEGEIVNINQTEKGTSILIKDPLSNNEFDNRIVLHINENTPIVNPLTDKNLYIKDLKVGDSVRAFYGPALTKSLPPQGVGKKIELLDKVTVTKGVITAITSNDYGTKRISIGDHENGIVLHICDDTTIVTKDNKKLQFKDLKKGMEIETYHSMIMTYSLPPITSAMKIVVK
jgi:hypothetical protein